jgi:catechol 2,3-dioxygenase-like lactoylglutathione lyase family enzyme
MLVSRHLVSPSPEKKEMQMNHGIKTIIVPVKDLAAAKALYAALLGVEPYADAPYYVGFRVGEQEIGLDPNGRRRPRRDHHAHSRGTRTPTN